MNYEPEARLKLLQLQEEFLKKNRPEKPYFYSASSSGELPGEKSATLIAHHMYNIELTKIGCEIYFLKRLLFPEESP